MPDQPQLLFVIDTSAIFRQDQFTAENIQLATPSLIENEMDQKGLKDTVALLKATDKLRIIDPSKDAIQRVKETAAQLGDLQYLSSPDIHLLALALDLTAKNLHTIILSDDYSIQNVAQRLSLEFKSVTSSGIREVIKWETYCSACGHKEPERTQESICPVCGTELKRRAKHKEQI
jgi:UPF0271 protein